MAHTLAMLAELVEGEVRGEANPEISAAAPLDDVGTGEITLIDRAENIKRLAGCSAAAVVLPRDVTDCPIPAIAVDDVHRAFTKILTHFRPVRRANRIGVSPAAMVHPTAQLGDDVDIHAGASIGDEVQIGEGSTIHAGVRILAGCRIGEHVTIFPNAVLYENTIVGPRTILHAGAILGAYGFGFKTTGGRHQPTAQLGYVEIEADVEVGACTTIDRGTYGATRIGEGTKIDNQVQIAHNCHIGRHNMICSQVGIAGSTSTGDYVVMAGQVGVRDHVHIGAQTVLAAKAGVVNDVPAGATYLGIPATPERKQKLLQAALTKLPEMRKQLRAMQRTIEALNEKQPPSRDQAAA